MNAHSQSLPQPIGMYNGGATCWLNATYQALTSLDPLMHIISARIHQTSECARNCTYIILHTMSAHLFRTHLGRDAILQHCTFATRPCANWQDIIGAITNRTAPTQYYDGSFARDARITDVRAFLASYPFAHMALILASQDQYAGLYLFCAMVLHCALTGARPLPEYGSIGEVSPSVINLITRALDVEATDARPMSSITRALFAIRSQSITLCANHFDRAQMASSSPMELSYCISIVPTSDVHEFVAQVRASIDMSERECQVCA
ncbi:MAG: hypothetical protein WC919_03915, partial [Candidatus Paceibacterota bacterium]